MYMKLVQVLHFEMLMTACIENQRAFLSHAVVCLCNWQRSNVFADWSKNLDKPPIFENQRGQRPKKRTCPGKPGHIVTLWTDHLRTSRLNHLVSCVLLLSQWLS